MNRAKKLSRAVGKPTPWCEEFLADFGDFSRIIARRFNLNHKVTDRNIARTIDAVRLRERYEDDPDEDDLAEVFGSAVKGVSFESQTKSEPSEDDLEEIFG